MYITLQYLGILAEKTGTATERVELSGTKTEIIKAILKKYPALEKLSFITAVNGKVMHGNADIQEGDQVALIPPAPGG